MSSIVNLDIDSRRLEDMFDMVRKETGVHSRDIAAIYDNMTESYDKAVAKLEYSGPTKVSAGLDELVTSKAISVLDCGSGTGLVGEELKARGFTNVTAVDISQESLNASAKRNIYRKLVCVNVGKDIMPFVDNEFDALVCCGGIVPAHISPEAIREWVRIVKKDGFIVFSIRRCYIEIMEGEEGFYSKELSEKVDEVLDDLKKTYKVDFLYKTEFPHYLRNSPAFLFAMRVL